MKRRWLILGAIASVVFGGIIYVTVAELHSEDDPVVVAAMLGLVGTFILAFFTVGVPLLFKWMDARSEERVEEFREDVKTGNGEKLGRTVYRLTGAVEDLNTSTQDIRQSQSLIVDTLRDHGALISRIGDLAQAASQRTEVQDDWRRSHEDFHTKELPVALIERRKETG